MLTKRTAKISPIGVEFIKKGEGHYAKVYDDLRPKRKILSWGSSWKNRNFKGTPTIGYGHVIWSKWVDKRSKWGDYLHSGSSFLSKDQAHQLLLKDLPRYEKPVRSYLTDNARFTQNMWDALISMAYNTGPYAKSIKAVAQAINEGDYQKGADLIRGGPKKSMGKYLKGLENRRNKEAALFLSEVPTSSFSPGIIAALSLSIIGLSVGAVAVKRKMGSKSISCGDCYEAAGRYMLENGMRNPNLRLVHGEVLGRGAIEGLWFGHAWIEDVSRDMVIDVANKRRVEMPKNVYYTLGTINMPYYQDGEMHPAKNNIFVYDMNTFRQKILENEHWGPWDLQTKF